MAEAEIHQDGPPLKKRKLEPKADFKAYYVAQKLLSAEEYETFFKIYSTHRPFSFWLNEHSELLPYLKRIFDSDHFKLGKLKPVSFV